jgi:hypothetical protein
VNAPGSPTPLLEPLDVPRLLDTAFSVYRRSIRALFGNIGLIALVYLVYLFFQGDIESLLRSDGILPLSANALTIGVGRFVRGLPLFPGQQLIVHTTVMLILTDISISVGAQRYLGEDAMALAAQAQRRLSFLQYIPLLLLLFPLVVLTGLLITVLNRARTLIGMINPQYFSLFNVFQELLAAYATPILLTLIAIAIISRFLIAFPVITLERVPVWTALRRSWELTRGAFLPCFATVLSITVFQALLINSPTQTVLLINLIRK